ncbi:hypothetical protein GCM10022381_15200 [Leifsonia kafniensis]|uniref:PPC domain-containing protein n=1 Tax=Leifsonia kafniensis TaxID=475957 RepID=A0ABP7KCL7_9MICO
MFSAELTAGRRFALVLQPGDDVTDSLTRFCRENGVEQGYLPVFLGAFSALSLIGTCEPVDDEFEPMPKSVHLTNVEGIGSGTIAWDGDGLRVLPHLHVAVGLKSYSATAYAGHLLAATVQYVTEIVVEEVTSPRFSRVPDPAARGIPNLSFTA